jgi:hypothetical protein
MDFKFTDGDKKESPECMIDVFKKCIKDPNMSTKERSERNSICYDIAFALCTGGSVDVNLHMNDTLLCSSELNDMRVNKTKNITIKLDKEKK